jgi:hypothetical protein
MFLAAEGNPIYGTIGIYKKIFGEGFDYGFVQFGDSLRFGRFGDTLLPYKGMLDPFIAPSSADINVIARRQCTGYQSRNQFRSDQPIPGIGQVKLEIEFLPGGE